MNCPICKHKMLIFGKIQYYIIYRCSNCGFGLTSGTKLQKGDYHRDDTYKEEEKLFRNIFSKRVKIIDKLMKPGKVLEIGSSTGIFLSLLQEKGWQVRGVEPSRVAAKIAEARGIPVLAEGFEKIRLTEKYDLIILNHTLEHLEDPIGVTKKAKSFLTPKGYIFIDLPNFDSWSAKVMKKNWPLLLPQEHLWHFTEKSMKLLLKDFRIVYVNKSSGIWDYGNPAKGLIQSLIGRKKRFFKEFFTAKPSWMLSKLGKGSDLMVIARKR